MKFLALILVFVAQSALACEVQDLRKEVFSYFTKNMPVENALGEKQALTTLKEMYLTDSMMRIRGEDFFITRLVFDILWKDGQKEEREILMAAVVDMANCKVETFESGSVLGSTISIRP